MDVNWTHGAKHMQDNHGVTVEQASEAIGDLDAVLYDPDPKSKSSKSARLLGYSTRRRRVLVVILVQREDQPGAWWGANGWDANSTDTNTYRQEDQR